MSENRPKPYLGNPQETIAVLNRYKFAFQKKFGQNFLIDTHVLERIIDEAGITPDDFVLEIGPGIGTMTQYLACAAREVVAVEIDKVLIPILEGDTLKAFDNVTVINEDILKVDINKLVEEKNGGRPIKVVANLPYYITTPIIMGLFESHVPIESITIMVQKGSCRPYENRTRFQRIWCPVSGGTVLCKSGDCSKCSSELLYASPNVGSAVIRLTRHETPVVDAKDEKLMFRIIRASFNQRRKTLVNGLKNSGEINFSKEQIEAAITTIGKPLTIRGEALTLAEFAALSNAFSDM